MFAVLGCVFIDTAVINISEKLPLPTHRNLKIITFIYSSATVSYDLLNCLTFLFSDLILKITPHVLNCGKITRY